MLVGEFLDRLERGETVTSISETLGVHRKTLQRRLRKLGYAWDADRLKWRWEGEEDEEPRNEPLIETNESPSNRQEASRSSRAPKPRPKEKSEEINSLPFTLDEIKDLKEMLRQWRAEPETAVCSEGDLVKKIEQIRNSGNEKVRKTIVIDQEIGDRFDEYAEKTRLNKSDLLHLALEELMNKYRLK